MFQKKSIKELPNDETDVNVKGATTKKKCTSQKKDDKLLMN